MTRKLPKPYTEEGMKSPIRPKNGPDDRPLTPERIVQITQQRGEFRVSWRYRDVSLNRACRRLISTGFLRSVRSPTGEYVYIPRKMP